MARITIINCDFSSQVPPHEAHFQIVGRGRGDAEKDHLDLDACVNHVEQMVGSLLFAPDLPAYDVGVKRLASVKILPAKSRDVGSSGESTKPCPLCGKEVKNLYSHARSHGLKNTHELRAEAEGRRNNNG